MDPNPIELYEVTQSQTSISLRLFFVKNGQTKAGSDFLFQNAKNIQSRYSILLRFSIKKNEENCTKITSKNGFLTLLYKDLINVPQITVDLPFCQTTSYW